MMYPLSGPIVNAVAIVEMSSDVDPLSIGFTVIAIMGIMKNRGLQ